MTALSQDLIKLSKATEGPTDFLRPEGLDYLPFQNAGILYGLSLKNVLLADEPGLGKTIQAIGILNQLPPRPLIIVCPAILRPNWYRELEKWLIHFRGERTIIHRSKSDLKRKPIGAYSTIITSYNYWNQNEKVFNIFKNFMEYDLIIDEVHYLKTKKAKRTKIIYAKNGLWSRARKIIAISGTPIVNRPMELYTTVARLAPELIGYKTQFQYGLRYCGGWRTPFNRWDFSGASHLLELGRSLRSGLMIRREKEKVLKDLPARFVNVVHLDPSSKTRSVIRQIQKYEQGVELGKAPKIAFEETSAARRELGNLKAPLALQYIVNQLEGGHKKIGVFFHHKEVGDYLKKNLGIYNASIVRGGQSDSNRQSIIDRFQRDGSNRVILCSISAANIGLTLTAASYIVFAEMSYIPGENSQAIDRFHRIGQNESVVADILVYPESGDEKSVKNLLKKEKNINQIY